MSQTTFDNKTPFLKWASEIILEHQTQLNFDTVVVLPSRRACNVARMYFTQLLSDKTAHILPEFIPIQEFIIQQSELTVPDKDILLLELHAVYMKHWPEDSGFDDFLPWGKMMLNDFDEIDKYLVDAKKLFAIIQDEKEIDAQFSIEQELKEIMSLFWKNISEDKEFEKKFLKTWEILGKIYQDYNQALLKKKIAYAGLTYKTLHEQLQIDDNFTSNFKQIHFVGFNAFSVAEENIIRKLSELTDVYMYWDTDEYFMQTPKHQTDFIDHEAGNFLKKYKKDFTHAQHYWNEGHELKNQKTYYIQGAPLYEGQVKIAAQTINEFISKLKEQEEPKPQQLGVILSDEKLIEPLLYAIDDMEPINITMSMPMGDSALTNWLDILYKINLEDSIHKSELDRLCKHYYIDLLLPESNQFKKSIQNSKTFYFSRKFLEKKIPSFMLEKSQTFKSLENISNFWLEQLDILQNTIIQNKTNKHQKLLDIIPYYIQTIQDKTTSLRPFREQLNSNEFYQLLFASIKSIAIPFLSKADSPIQIMGFLESRLMDFDRVMILSANEEILPQQKKGNSYIPYGLRKPFKLPTLKEYDGIYAYHFFRLLKRSQNTHLIYNNAPGDLPFEKSRLVRQVELELKHPSNRILHEAWDYNMHSNMQQESLHEPLIIQKKQEHIDILKGKEISQSALQLYLRCPIQFYMRYIAQIYEQEETEEIMNAMVFGNILHKAIESFYMEFPKQKITSKLIQENLHRVEKCLKEAIADQYMAYSELQGRNLLAYDMILQSLKKIIDTDIKLAKEEPFEIVGIEEKCTYHITLNDGTTVQLQGIIDRVDKLQSHYRILDYKTGRVKLIAQKNFSPENIQIIFERHKIDNTPQTFQGLFYHLLLQKPMATVGFYSVRDLSQGITFMNKNEPIPEDIMQAYEEHIKDLLEEIFDLDKPFIQNKDAKAYEYSPYQFAL